MIDPAIGTLLSGAFALLFASAAFHKARQFAHFAAVFRAYRLVPPALPLAAFVPILELSVAAGLLLPVARPAAAVTGAALLLLYASAIGVNLLRGRHDLSCGCGGPDERRPIAAWMVVRNLLLAALLGAAALPWVTRALQGADFLTVAAGMAVAGLLYMSADRLLGQVAPRSASWGDAP